jgi:hypothetical protein
MIVDIGGGTVDLIVHEKQEYTLKEVSKGSGGLYGGVYVDQEYWSYLRKRIPCLSAFADEYPRQALQLKNKFESHKRGFRGSGQPITIELPSKLVDMWE